MKFTLNHLTGSRAGSVQELVGQVITIGRDPGNQVSFDPALDSAVSGFHATLTVQGAQVLLSDLGSSNGTLVNGSPIQGLVPLISGATVQFGKGGPILSVQFAPLGPAGAAGPGSAAAGAGGLAASGASGPGGVAGPTGAAAASSPSGSAGIPTGAPAGGASASGASASGGAPAGAGAAPPGAAPPGAPVAGPAASAAPAAPKPPVFAKLKSCGISAVASVVVTLAVGGVCYLFRAKLQQVVPPSVQTHLRKIPGVKLIFSQAKAPAAALPPGARDAQRAAEGLSKSEAPEPSAAGGD